MDPPVLREIDPGRPEETGGLPWGGSSGSSRTRVPRLSEGKPAGPGTFRRCSPMEAGPILPASGLRRRKGGGGIDQGSSPPRPLRRASN